MVSDPDARKPRTELVKLRKKVNLSQRKLAALIDVNYTTVSGWETGTRYPRLDLVQYLIWAAAVNCSVEELIVAIEDPAAIEEAYKAINRIRKNRS